MSTPPAELIRETITDLLGRRRPDASICPSEVARAIAPADWRPLMPAVVDVARAMAREGRLRITQGSEERDPDDAFVGPIRLRATRE